MPVSQLSPNRAEARPVIVAARLVTRLTALHGVGTRAWPSIAASEAAACLHGRWAGVGVRVQGKLTGVPTFLVGTSQPMEWTAPCQAVIDALLDPASRLWNPQASRSAAGAKLSIPWRSRSIVMGSNRYKVVLAVDDSQVHPDDSADLLRFAASLIASRAAVAFQPNSTGEVPVLTDRQHDVVRLLAEGLDTTEVAQKLGLSPHTVHQHAKTAHQRLGVCSRSRLIARFMGVNAVSVDPEAGADDGR